MTVRSRQSRQSGRDRSFALNFGGKANGTNGAATAHFLNLFDRWVRRESALDYWKLCMWINNLKLAGGCKVRFTAGGEKKQGYITARGD
jgi:hypothetical protein